jgi:bla regulator protein BlaR1
MMDGISSLLQAADAYLEEGLVLAIIAGGCAALIAMVVLAINVLFRRWVTASQMGVLWALVLLRLVIPSAPVSSLSLQNLFQSSDQDEARVAVPPKVAAAANNGGEASAANVNRRTVAEDMVASPEPAVASEKLWADAAIAALEHFVELLPVIWASGLVLIIGNSLRLHRRFYRHVNAAPRCQDNAILELWRQCSDHAGIRHALPIIISDRVEQPAVMGAVRPKLLLPEEATSWTHDNLRMVMLHELSHIRRWDVAANWGLLFIRAVQWWNPVYWLAASRYASLREQACDSFAVAHSDGYPTKAYGELLLAMAERPMVAARWRVMVPALMVGIFPPRLRSRSLSHRLDALQRGVARRGTPQTIAAVAAMFAVAVTGFTDAASVSEPASKLAPTPELARLLRSKGTAYLNTPTFAGPSEVRSYDVRRALEQIKSSASANKSDAELVLLATLRVIFPPQAGTRKPSTDEGGRATGRSDATNDLPRFQINENQLVAHGPRSLHDELSRVLEAWNACGLSQFSVSFRIINADRDLAAELGISWQSIEAFTTQQASDDVDLHIPDSPVLRAAAGTNEYRPIAVTTLDKRQTAALINAAQGDRRANILMAPRITAFNGQQASIVDRAQRPFVVGVAPVVGELTTAAQPKIAVLEEGSCITWRATQTGEAAPVRLRASLQFDAVTDVATATAILHGRPVTIQTPKVKSAGFDVSADFIEGRMLLVGCLPAFEQKDYFYTLISVDRVAD